ncbi:chymotrypsin-2-like [Diachasmimorpha longicaudata]|uniref:chymotrypsin-2-like n=1 Tax=Diachasmimorpha longicaudata TaxID=58733 RepID=UPI0030B8A09B
MTHWNLTLRFAAICLFYCLIIQGLGARRLRRMSGGTEADSSVIFYQASLRSDDYHFCGGAIISEKHILTAAHCVADLFVPPYDDLTVVTGSGALRGGNQHEVFNVSWHQEFHLESRANDIAVITLRQEINYDEFQGPVLLPESPPPYNVKGVVSGFGRLKKDNIYPSKTLQRTSAVVITREDCQKFMNYTLLHGQICGSAPRGVGIQKGDSGGPLVVDNVVVGIASWNIPWDPAAPDGYTDVYEYMDFIKMIMKQNNSTGNTRLNDY